MSNIDKQSLREQFEAWWEVNYHNGNPPRFGWEYWRDGDGYKIDDDESELDGMWESWQAAHSSKLEAEQRISSTWRKTAESNNEKLEAAERRIAELEAREVREEGNLFLVVRHPGKAPVIKHSAGDLESFLRQLLENDPMATIDIVTHRYYGVGGQWVQDADEYLHMMTAAAGKGE